MPLALVQSSFGSRKNNVTLGYARALHRTYKADIQNMLLCVDGNDGMLLVEFKKLDGKLAGRFTENRVVKTAPEELVKFISGFYYHRRAAFYCLGDLSFKQCRGSEAETSFWDAAQFLEQRLALSWKERPAHGEGPFEKVVGHPASGAFAS